jgi:hypothetical protein
VIRAALIKRLQFFTEYARTTEGLAVRPLSNALQALVDVAGQQANRFEQISWSIPR